MPLVRRNAQGKWYIRGRLSGEYITWSPLSSEACAYIKGQYGKLYDGLNIAIKDIHYMIQTGYMPNREIKNPDQLELNFEGWEDIPEEEKKPLSQQEAPPPQGSMFWQRLWHWFHNLFGER